MDRATATALMRALRPAIPAVIGAAALTFLFAAVMPMSWVAGISWNLYLDRLSDFFVPPVGNAARLTLAFGMAAVAAIFAGLVALLIAQPEAAGLSSLRRRFRSGADDGASDDDGLNILARRRRVDRHPDDAPRPPIRAGRDLPAGGLGPLRASATDEAAQADPLPVLSDAEIVDELVLADLAPVEDMEPGEEPWLQPAEIAPGAMPDPTDHSLGAMVARLEAGLARRRLPPAAATAAIPVPEELADGAPEVDFALEAALGTLQRMTRQAVG
ncbi:hypothetical protein [Sphingopyxis sp. JAI128]|uniref:hypothetical protein n=1 Tax=Sphingopyxis sp. JAI128 TaxID=2723066 RepID=UPI0017E2D0D5|nr:hypothetical protein [Sphingopyxis sp. JAI128]MBB6427556.1 hypothetical protein [Sphingopyxis sp. JAI128]